MFIRPHVEKNNNNRICGKMYGPAPAPGHKYALAAGLAVLLLFLQGCSIDPEEARKQVIAYDPSFRDVLREKDAIIKKLEEKKSDFDKKTSEIDAGIAALKNNKSMIRAEYDKSVDALKKQLDPRKRTLQLELVDLKRKMKRKIREENDIKKDIAEVNSLVEKKDQLDLTREEISAWNRRLATLTGRAGETGKAIAGMKEELRIKKLKLKLLKIR